MKSFITSILLIVAYSFTSYGQTIEQPKKSSLTLKAVDIKINTQVKNIENIENNLKNKNKNKLVASPINITEPKKSNKQ